MGHFHENGSIGTHFHKGVTCTEACPTTPYPHGRDTFIKKGPLTHTFTKEGTSTPCLHEGATSTEPHHTLLPPKGPSRLELTKVILTYRSRSCSHSSRMRVSLFVSHGRPLLDGDILYYKSGDHTKRSINNTIPQANEGRSKEGEKNRQASCKGDRC